MVQTDSCTSVATQLLTQTQYSEQTASKDDGKTQFQDLMEQKCKTVSDSTTKDATVKVEEKSAVQQKKEQPEEDPIVAQMAAADLVVAQTVVTLPDVAEEAVDVSADVAQVAAAALETPEQSVEQVQTTQQQSVAEKPVDAQTETQSVTEQQPQEAQTPVVMQTVTQSHETEEPETQVGQQEENVFSPSGDDDTTVTVTDAGADVAQPVFHNVEENMVKVGEAHPTEEDQQAEDVSQQVVQQLTTGLSQGETKVEVKLSPSSLGNVTVEVTAQEDGTLHIALSAENIHTKALLEQHTASLQDLVSVQTQRPVQVEVTQRQEEQQSNLQEDGRNGQSGYQQQQQQQRQSQHSEDFLQKLRLGLIPLNVETTE